jgi:hypothetical protein
VGVSSLTVEEVLEMRNFGYSAVVWGKEELRRIEGDPVSRAFPIR